MVELKDKITYEHKNYLNLLMDYYEDFSKIIQNSKTYLEIKQGVIKTNFKVLDLNIKYPKTINDLNKFLKHKKT